MPNKCYLRINCKNTCSYYYNYKPQKFIKFDISIHHLANTFNFYNRSSIKTEMRIFGVTKPLFRIDSYKLDKRAVQKITNTMNIRLTPSIDDFNRISQFLRETNPNDIRGPTKTLS